MIRENPQERIHMPSPTAWPFVLAFGVALLSAGLVTSASVSILGAVFIISGAVGWFRELFPQEATESVRPEEARIRIATNRPEVARLSVAPAITRVAVPIEIYPAVAGIKGGIAGGVAMAIIASAFGLLKTGSIWYPINLLAAAIYTQSLKFGSASLSSFHLDSLLIATVIHLITSLLVGLLYGAMLPMIPRRPILLGGLIAPVLWSGLLYTFLGLVNPLLNARIDWTWFVISQVGFGVVAGIIVARQTRVQTIQHLPFAARAGVEASGLKERSSREDGA
jgi:hypothetical protein